MLRVAVLGDTESIQGFAAIGLDIFPCDDPGLAPGLFHRLCGGEYGVVYITEELAALLDVPADELQKTIDRYNELCDQGTDADFGKKSAYMHKIEKAPFWGVRKHIRVSSIDSGVNTNANGQALDADGKVIEGLYCVGNVGGVFYGGADYPFHQTGLSLGRCYTFGMLAAKHAMGK